MKYPNTMYNGTTLVENMSHDTPKSELVYNLVASSTYSEMSKAQRVHRVLVTIGGVCLALGLLYVFICALDVLTSSFQLLAGRKLRNMTI